MCGTFEPPLRIPAYLDAIYRILPTAEISTKSEISRCNTIHNM